MSTLYHPQCRFGSEGQKCLSVLRLWKDMKKEGCSCCWEIETLLYITTSGDLSALQLTTTTTTPTTIPVSVSVSLSLSFSLWLCSGSFSLSILLLHFTSHPLFVFIQCIYPCSCLAGCTCICICVHTSLYLIEFATFRPPPPSLSVLAARLYLSGISGTF